MFDVLSAWNVHGLGSTVMGVKSLILAIFALQSLVVPHNAHYEVFCRGLSITTLT